MELVRLHLALAAGFSVLGAAGGFLLASYKKNVPCGTPHVQPYQDRIVGGSEAIVGSFPWTVVLAELNYPLCGGAILNERVILTAAHCFEDEISRDPRRWRIMAGKHHINKYDFTQQSHSVRQILIHENYNQRSVENDVALLLLNDKMYFTDYIRPICLPTSLSSPPPGTLCFMAGWGDTHGTSDSTVLNQVAVPVVSDAQCARPDWYGKNFYPDTSFCAGYSAGGKDACSGDSGGPLVCKSAGRWQVEGISSWGFGCAEPRWPGIYTEVAKYTDWIKKAMDKYGVPYTYS